MHPSVLLVHRRFNPLREGDEILWNPKDGLLVEEKKRKGKRYLPGKGVFHGMDAWASIRNRESRMRVKFDKVQGDFPFPEEFRQRKRTHKNGRMINRRSRKKEIDTAYHRNLAKLHDSQERAGHDGIALHPISV